MEMQLFLISNLLVTITTISAFDYTDCQSELMQCKEDLTNNITKQHGADNDALCNDMQDYLACSFSPNCGLASSEEAVITEYAETFLQDNGVSCSFSVRDVIKGYRNDAIHINGFSFPILASFGFILVYVGKLLV